MEILLFQMTTHKTSGRKRERLRKRARTQLQNRNEKKNKINNDSRKKGAGKKFFFILNIQIPTTPLRLTKNKYMLGNQSYSAIVTISLTSFSLSFSFYPFHSL